MNTLSLEVKTIPIAQMSNARSTFAYVSKSTRNQVKMPKISHRLLNEESSVVIDKPDKAAFITQEKEAAALKNAENPSKTVSESQEFTITGDFKTNMTKDPAAVPRNPKSFLLQDSQFSDLFTFGNGETRGLKNRVGPRGYNPFLEEIEERLRDPEGRIAMLEKSLLSRQDPKHQRKTKRKVEFG